MAYQEFKELRVWQEAKSLAAQIYKIGATTRLSKDYGLRDQIQRSDVSIASNIAEGYEKNSNRDFMRHLFIAKGSLSELRTQLDIATEVGYVDAATYLATDDQCKKINAMLIKLIKARRTAS